MHNRVIRVDCVSSAGKIAIEMLIVRQHIKDVVIDSAETECRALVRFPLRRVVEHQVQNHLNASAVECLDHFLEFMLLLTCAAGTAM